MDEEGKGGGDLWKGIGSKGGQEKLQNTKIHLNIFLSIKNSCQAII